MSNIQKEAQLEAFAPRISFYKETRAGRKRFVEAVFPGYVFARCSLKEHLRFVLSMRGVSGVVRYGNRVPSLPDSLIEALKSRFRKCGGVLALRQDNFRQGDPVNLIDGPFKGFDAIFEHYLPSENRVQILVAILGRSVSITVDSSKVLSESSERSRAVGF